MRRGWLILISVMLFAGVPTAPAQIPTEDQLELLRSMSPEDREALLEQLGLDGAILGEGGGPRNDSRRDETRKRDGQDRRNLERGSQELMRERTLKPDDTDSLSSMTSNKSKGVNCPTVRLPETRINTSKATYTSATRTQGSHQGEDIANIRFLLLN